MTSNMLNALDQLNVCQSMCYFFRINTYLSSLEIPVKTVLNIVAKITLQIVIERIKRAF